MEVIVKLGKTNAMTNTWGKTKTKTDKDKNLENKRITVKFCLLGILLICPFCLYALRVK